LALVPIYGLSATGITMLIGEGFMATAFALALYRSSQKSLIS
jgi:hypothetical protein